MRRPVIGVTGSLEEARWGSWHAPALLSPRNYAVAVQRAGGLVVVLSPDEATVDDPAQLLDMLDGLVLAGGADIDPSNYGQEPHPETTGTNLERDRFELALARGALERDMPVLGICRGMELLNILRGGTLVQHLPDIQTHRHTPGTFCEHDVVLAAGSLAARAAGAERVHVRSHHHQGIGDLGAGLEPTGHFPGDETIEAIELPDRGFVLGVLWHPEEDVESRVIASLVAEAGDRARSSPS
jgi:putative glutamine amidotransferase